MENYIKHIEIKNLWNLYDIAFDCDPKVNILVGKNGSGKSTVLQSVKMTLEKDDLSKPEYKDATDVTLSTHNPFDSWLRSEDVYVLVNKVNNFKVDFIYIDTFDTIIKENKDSDFILKSLFKDKKTPLDIKLRNSIDGNYTDKNLIKVDRTNKEIALQLYDDIKNVEAKKYRNKLENFLKIINSFLEDTNKEFFINKDSKAILRINNNFEIDLDSISSGEKQLLIILINIFLTEEEPTIIFMDEPELSLHPSWQRKLIETIFKINPNIQLFIATHSPSILSEGWKDKLIHMEDITSKTAVAKN